jgi:hypothetical protein
MTPSSRTRPPIRPCAALADAGGAVLSKAPLNHGSEVPEWAGLRSANCGEETLPTIGKGIGKRERPGRDGTRWINNVRRVSCPQVGVDERWRS